MISILVGTLDNWVPYYDPHSCRGHLLVGFPIMISILVGTLDNWVPYYDPDSCRGHLLVGCPIMISIFLGDTCLLGALL